MYESIYKALHEVTGSMALLWIKWRPDDARRWAEELRQLAVKLEEMAKTRKVI